MRQESEQPQARTSDLVVKGVGEELLVYDLARHRAHSLNRVAAAVWRACDGTRGVAALGTAAERESGQVVPVEAVRYALQSLGRAQLMEGPVAEGGLTRREVMTRLGTAAAVALPLVTTIIAPTAAQAQSGCLTENDLRPCVTASQCCANGCGGPCVCAFSKDRFRCVRPTIGDPPKQ